MLNLKNRFIMAPLKLGYSDGNGNITDKHLNFYARRGKFLGAIALEPLYMDKALREIPTQIGIDTDDKLSGLKNLTDILHQTDTKVIAHLNHPGRMANPKIPGNYFLSSTDKPCEAGGATPKRMTKEDIQKVVELFASSAKRATEAGFDIIELQFGHGYLIAQFLSPAVNDRTDEYGGSLENRSRLAMEILQAVQEATHLPIIVRISGDELTEKGFHIDEMIVFSKMLKDKGVKAVHVSAGTICNNPPWFFQHMFVPKGKTWEMASKIKNAANVPVISLGRINSKKDVDYLINQNKSDYIAIGRALVADPDFVGKITGQISEIIRPCLACAEGCLGGVKSGKGLACVVNPDLNAPTHLPKTDKQKSIAIVGGGLAGMEAATRLKQKEHRVKIFEKNVLGGQFNLAWLPPKKESLKEIIDYYQALIKEQQIDVVQQEINSLNELQMFDAIVLATGAVPVVPPIQGLKEYYWADYLLEQNLPENQKIVVVGGGLIGVEMASKLVDLNNEVIIVEMADELAKGMEMIERKMTLAKLKAKHVKIYLSHKLINVDGNKLTLQANEEITLSDVDKIILTAGMKSYNPFKQDKMTNVFVVGDAKQVAKAQEAIADGYKVQAMI
jgi:2,4-dienoyl-CoA reductase-like NADH-dependent reductase (Old Yellow Enzyme family)/thioredoxin reductase